VAERSVMLATPKFILFCSLLLLALCQPVYCICSLQSAGDSAKQQRAEPSRPDWLACAHLERTEGFSMMC